MKPAYKVCKPSESMNLVFVINRKGKLLSVVGKITGWSIEAAADSLITLKLKIETTGHRIDKEANITPIVQLPGLDGDGWARVAGATDYDLKAKVINKSGSLTVTFYITGFYSSYEDACAAEMKNIMERK